METSDVIRHRQISDSLNLIVNEAGLFQKVPSDAFDLANTHSDREVTDKRTLLFERAGIYLKHKRESIQEDFTYLILVPTLRCNLSCSYCQVSRVNDDAVGFDWSPEVENGVLKLIDNMEGDSPKIEFQGGEPLLRLDILKRIRAYCRKHFTNPEFVICSNLQDVDEDAWSFFDAPDTYLSTSFDGTGEIHQAQRSGTQEKYETFASNLQKAIQMMGADRVSALPTIDVNNLPSPIELIENFASLGLRSIYLRPINHLGFARKQHQALNVMHLWNDYRREFVAELISFNTQNVLWMEEFYFSHCLRRVFRSGCNNHVDLRNPNPMGKDYMVVDYDGVLYPTDEARMITRAGQIDLSIGNVFDGISQTTLQLLNTKQTNNDDPRCAACVYQPYCGVDRIDDISRYGTIELDRHETDFCRQHLDVFDHIFDLVYSDDQDVKKSLAFWLGISNFDPLLSPVMK